MKKNFKKPMMKVMKQMNKQMQCFLNSPGKYYRTCFSF